MQQNCCPGGSPQADLLLGRLPSLLPFVQEFWQGSAPQPAPFCPGILATKRPPACSLLSRNFGKEAPPARSLLSRNFGKEAPPAGSLLSGPLCFSSSNRTAPCRKFCRALCYSRMKKFENRSAKFSAESCAFSPRIAQDPAENSAESCAIRGLKSSKIDPRNFLQSPVLLVLE